MSCATYSYEENTMRSIHTDLDDIITARMASEGLLQDKIIVRRRCMETRKKRTLKSDMRRKCRGRNVGSTRGLLESYALRPWPSFLVVSTNHARVNSTIRYPIFMFKLMHNGHVGVSNLVEHCTVKYFCSNNFVIEAPVKRRKLILKFRV